MDPHLYRIARLNSPYRIPAAFASAVPAVADWLAKEVPDAFIIGADSESEQWVRSIAARAGLPHQVLAKTRRGDHDVWVTLSDAAAFRGAHP